MEEEMNSFYRGAARLATLAVLLLALAACGSDAEEPSADPAPEEEPDDTDTEAPDDEEESEESADASECPDGVDSIGYSPLTMEFDYFQFTVEGMREAAEACGVEIAIDDPGVDAAAQVSGIENLITAGADAIAIVSVDPEAVQTGVSAARAADVFVISQVSTFENADVYVGLIETEFGRLQGELAAQAVVDAKPDVETYKVAILNADSLGEGLLDRKEGLVTGLEQTIDNYEIVADVEAFAEDTALSAVENILQANPDLDLILTVNDPGSLGARSAVQAAGLSLTEEVVVGGLGIDRRVLEGVLAGDFPGTVSPEPVETGRTLVRVAFQLLRGETVESQVDVVPIQITTENAQQYIDELYG
jgi:ABC-type sugar transport system substrate-binding protein